MPSAVILFTNGAGHITAEPDEFLRVSWNAGPRKLAQTQALFEQVVLALRQHNWSRVLIDQTRMEPFNGTEQAWVASDWLPHAVQDGGYRHGAVLVSPTVLVRLATAFITTSVKGLPLTYRSFDREAEAIAWLQQQPTQP